MGDMVFNATFNICYFIADKYLYVTCISVRVIVEQIFSYIMTRTSCILSDDDDVRYVLDQHA